MTLSPVVRPVPSGSRLRLAVLAVPLCLARLSPAQAAEPPPIRRPVRRRAREARRGPGAGARGSEARDRGAAQAARGDEAALALRHNRLAEMEKAAPAPTASAAVEERLAEIEASVQQIPDVPKDVVAAGDFPGSIRIPGTDVGLRRSAASCGRPPSPPSARSAPRTGSSPPRSRWRAARGRKGVALRPDRHPEPVQPGPPDADGRRSHAGLHRGRLRGIEPGLPPAPRLRPVAGPGDRPDLVHLRRPRGRA